MLEKSRFCNEKLSDLVPVEGGSKCLRCQEILKDFRNNSFSEMKEIQSSPDGPHCGIYSKRQIEQWDNATSSFPFSIGKKGFARMAMLSSLLLSLHPTKASTEIYTPPIRHQQEIGIFEKYPVFRLENKVSVMDSIVIEGMVIDSLTQEPLIGVVVSVEPLKKGAYTDMQGKFRIVIEKSIEFSFPLTLIVKFFNYSTQEIELVNKEKHLLQIELSDDGIKGEEVFIGMYFRRFSKFRTFWWKVKGVFRRKNKH